MKIKSKLFRISSLGLLTFLFLILFTRMMVAQKSETSNIIDTMICDLIKNPEKYDGKIVRVKGIYRNFFEIAELYCPECYDSKKRIWVDFKNIDDFCLKSKETIRLKKGRTLLVVFVGKFEASELNYGHSNGYRFQLDLECVAKSKVLSKNRPLLPSELKEFGIAENCQ